MDQNTSFENQNFLYEYASEDSYYNRLDVMASYPTLSEATQQIITEQAYSNNLIYIGIHDWDLDYEDTYSSIGLNITEVKKLYETLGKVINYYNSQVK